MATTVHPELLGELKRHGAFDVSACFHCGNCTAVCPLSAEGASFPRKLIRLGQIGARQALLSSPDAWLCYHCGECSDTCPREADPGEYMAAVRRYAIAETEPTGLARLMYRSGGAMLLATLALAALLSLFLVGIRGSEQARGWLFSWVPYQTVHVVGQVVFALAGLSLLVSLVTAARRMLGGTKWPGWPRAGQALRQTVVEVVTMKRHRDETASPDRPLWQTTAGVHLAIMYGFLGLFAATILDYLFLVLLPLHLTVFWPARLLGTVSGAVMLYGVGLAVWRRLTKEGRNTARSLPADWWLLSLLLILAVTGFWLEVAVTAGAGGPLHNLVLLLHAALAMELVLLVGFTKLAHVIYRPLALLAHNLRNVEES